MLSKNGQLIVISAPSGAGKTSAIKSVIRELNDQNEESKFSVSHTTRSPREGDTDGSDYFFVTDKVFDELSESGTFIEPLRCMTINMEHQRILLMRT